MSDLEKYNGHVMQQRGEVFEMPPDSGEHREGEAINLIPAIVRHWRMALLVFLAACAIGIPLIWKLMLPRYSVTGAIRVAPTLSNILTGEADTEISDYQSFVNTQAEMITSSHVIQRVADELAGRNMSFFTNPPDDLVVKLEHLFNRSETKQEPVGVLRQAMSKQLISISPARNTELIKITMLWDNPEEARQIINAFIRAYMAIEVSATAKGQDEKVGVLESEQKVLSEKLQRQRTQIYTLAQEYGTTTLDKRQDMMLSRVTDLLTEVTQVEARRNNLEAQLKFLEQRKDQALSPQESMKMRNEYINSDPTIRALTQQMSQLDLEFVRHKQKLTANNPTLKDEQDLLNVLNARLEDKRQELSKAFDGAVSEEISKAGVEKLNNVKVELEQAKVLESNLRERLAKEDTDTIEIGRKQLAIHELESQMSLTQATYDKIFQRIQELEMERKRPVRITVAYEADIDPINNDKRVKSIAGLMFGAMAFGILLAFLRDKADRRLHTPNDVFKHTGIRVIGTITAANAVNKVLLPGMIAQDYQTIHSNLGLLDGEGIPKRLVITSPGVAEGKTTFAINLATSLSRVGKKVLLIDGDLRKPDIAYLLNMPKGSRGLQEIAFQKNGDQSACFVVSSGFDVLAADSSNADDACELLALLQTNQRIHSLSQKYDHIIIDTPPVLAFSDALVWAKMADAVVLMSDVRQTTAHDLNEARERLSQINVRVLGIILSNVQAGHGYHRYGYGYYSQNEQQRTGKKRGNRKTLLLPLQSENNTIQASDTETGK